MAQKIILITGASSGIGRDTALALAARGHKVYAAARRTALLEPLKAHAIEPLHMDVTDEQTMADGVGRILEREGRIDVLINNAGYGYFGPIETVNLAEARRQLEVNLFGLARLCQLVMPVMRRQRSGRIVNLSSVAGRAVFYFGGWYHVSKYSVEALSDALRMEAEPFGIQVSMIEPGAIKTDWGIIASDHLRASAAGTPYEGDATRWAATMRSMYTSDGISHPRVVTRAILRAVDSSHPRPRYRIGRLSGTILFFHSVLPARWWDALMRLGAKMPVRDHE